MTKFLLLLAALCVATPLHAQGEARAPLLGSVLEALEEGDVEALKALPDELKELVQEASDPLAADEIVAVDLSAAGLDFAKGLGLDLLDQSALPGLGFSLARLKLPRGLSRVLALAALVKNDPLGLYGANLTYRLAEAAATPGCEGLRCMGHGLVGWPLQGCAAKLRLGMIDSAVDASHPALRGASLTQQRIGPGRASAREREHGTAIAGLLVGRAGSGFAGLLPEATLRAADVFVLDAKGAPATDVYKLVQGLDWLAGQPLDALNISLAGPDSPVLHKAIRVLDARGIAVAAAVGNRGPAAPAQYPAAYAEVLAVTAVDRQLRPYAQAGQGRHVRVAAPGVALWTAAGQGSGAYRDGSSYAVPFATAALALQHQARPRLTAAQNIGLLMQGSRDLGAPGVDAVTGAGLLQAPPCTVR